MNRGGIWVALIFGVLLLASFAIIATGLIQQVNLSQTMTKDNLMQTVQVFTIPIIFMALLSGIVLGVARV